MLLHPEPAQPIHHEAIKSLYLKVSSIGGGLARTSDEITLEYLNEIQEHSRKNGIQLIIHHPNQPDIIVAEIHGYKLIPKVFDHVISNVTIVIDPDFQGKGLGSIIFKSFLQHIEQQRSDIYRVELIVRESNDKAIKFYEKLGFVQEGRLLNRIKSLTNTLEADIPMAWFNNYYKP